MRTYDIGTRMGLRLFQISKPSNTLGFPAANDIKGLSENFLKYEDAIGKELIIDIQAKKGNVPKTITKKISNIIAEGDKDSHINGFIGILELC